MVYPLSNVDLIPLFRSYFFILHVPTDNPLNPCFCCLRLLMISHLTPKMFFVLKAVGSSSSKQGQRKSFQHLSAFFVVLSQELDFFPLRGDYLPTKTSFSPLRTHTKKSLFFQFSIFFRNRKNDRPILQSLPIVERSFDYAKKCSSCSAVILVLNFQLHTTIVFINI